MADQLSVWHAEHVTFSRLLQLLEQEVAAFTGGGRPDYDLMFDVIFYLRHFSDRYHHPREDVAFARIVQRDPAMELSISRLLQEHRVIAVAGDELYNRLTEAVGDVIAPRSVLEAAAATYLVYYRHHLAKEEREVLPRAAQLLTRDDWAAVAGCIPTVPDPLFGGEIKARLRELRRRRAD